MVPSCTGSKSPSLFLPLPIFPCPTSKNEYTVVGEIQSVNGIRKITRGLPLTAAGIGFPVFICVS